MTLDRFLVANADDCEMKLMGEPAQGKKIDASLFDGFRLEENLAVEIQNLIRVDHDRTGTAGGNIVRLRLCQN